MEIKAYKCDQCGSINESKKEYDKCQRECKKAEELRLKEEELSKSFLQNSDKIRLSITHIHQLAPEIVNFFKNHLKRDLTLNIDHLRFGNIANTHSYPIDGIENWQRVDGKPKHYLGWSGRISGTTDIYTHPIKHPLYGKRGEIRGISDCFGRYDTSLIRGIHTGTGGGGDSFSYSLELYLDDFPKIKETYKTFIELKNKSQLRTEKAKELDIKAKEKLIYGNQKIKDFNTYALVLSSLTKRNESSKHKEIQNIMNSKEWNEATIVPKEYDFDVKIYNELLAQFGV